MSIFLGLVFYVAIGFTVGMVCDCVNMRLEASVIIGLGWPITVPYLIVVWGREYIISLRKE